MRKFSMMFGATLVAVLFAGGSGVASAQQYPIVDGGALVVSSAAVSAGGAVTVAGSGCLGGTDVAVGLSSGESGSEVGSTTADDDGDFETSVTIPAATPAGDYTLVSVCLAADGESTLRLSTAITVGGAGAGADGDDDGAGAGADDGAGMGGTLPRTGTETGTLGQVAFAMIVLGAAMVALVVRRRNTHGAGLRPTVDA